jgi:hypothetical protein
MAEEVDGVGHGGVRSYCNSCTDTLGGLLNMSLRYASFFDEAFYSSEANLPVSGLLSTSVRLSGFLNYQMSD